MRVDPVERALALSTSSNTLPFMLASSSRHLSKSGGEATDGASSSEDSDDNLRVRGFQILITQHSQTALRQRTGCAVRRIPGHQGGTGSHDVCTTLSSASCRSPTEGVSTGCFA